MSVPELFTIGYEGASQPALLWTLAEYEIQTLLDIRELPQSRKPSLSKTALGDAARSQGIAYEHIRALGTPRDVRYRRKIDHDQAAFKTGFLEHLDQQDDAMSALVARIPHERCCLLCYEADPHVCHRWFVAERAAEMRRAQGGDLSIVHLEITAV